ncbi:hypothetical protein [Chitiniphilus shinanonensis]|uniref:hypothetical protein n=1 Tax=Chitiniphilus shinanonensis TaxID=553088 RepID=UPI0030753762
MADPVVQLLSDQQDASGRTLTVGPDGVALQLVVPPGRRLDRVRLTIKAVDTTGKAATGITLSSDTGNFTAATRWARAEWGEERALVGLAFGADTAGAAGRIRILSDGVWLPLAPLDTLAVNKAAQSFVPQAASALAVEVLAQQGDMKVLVPNPAILGGLSLTVTDQPCHAALAVGDDPPFFRHAGVLPATPVEIGGLARLANRHLLDHPGSNVVPLRLLAAAPRKIRIDSFSAVLVPETPAPTPGGGGGSGGGSGQPSEDPNAPRPGEITVLQPAQAQALEARRLGGEFRVAQRFRWDDAQHALSAVGVYARRLDHAPQAQLTLHADHAGVPGDQALLPPLSVAVADGDDAGWLRARWPEPLKLPAGDYWLSVTAQGGEALWYTAAQRPAGAGAALIRIAGGPWLPLPDDTAWAQLGVHAVPIV